VNAWSPAWYFATGTGYLIVLMCFWLLPTTQQDHLWRIVVGFGAVPAVIVLLVRRRFMAESPQWLADQGDLRGAVDVLSSLYVIAAELAADAAPRAPSAKPSRPAPGSRTSSSCSPRASGSARSPPCASPCSRPSDTTRSPTGPR
jgi:hypothetical protein